MTNVKDEIYTSFALELTRLNMDQLSYTIKSNEAGIESVVVRPFEIPTDSDGSIWLKWNTEFEEIEYERLMPGYNNLEGKTVIIGVSASGLGAQIPTPGGLMNPNQLQAAALQTILSDNPISRPLWADSIEILVSGILALLLILLVYRAPIWASGLGFVVLCVGQAGLTFYIWNKFYRN